jgi:Skp family chaperone for outer membrane proteins
MKTMLRYLIIGTLLFAAVPLMAQSDSTSALASSAGQDPALDFFNTASKQYVRKDKAGALRTLDRALKQYPGDARLLKLAEELIKEDQQQQQQQQQQEQEQQQEQQQQERKQEQEQRAQREQQREREGEMSRKEAERLLDALDREERAVQAKVRDKQRPGERRPTDKDW